MAQFAELLDTAIANADSRDQLTASRARLLTAGDDARRRVVRDLHDGAQQRLVHTIITLKLAQQRGPARSDGEAGALVGEALEHAEQANAELRELAHGILPRVAHATAACVPALDAVVARLDLPVDVDVPPERFPAEIEASAYFIVAEALTNVVKHAQRRARRGHARPSRTGCCASRFATTAIGGADPGGHGLVGMRDRVTALGGRLEIESPPAAARSWPPRCRCRPGSSRRPYSPPSTARSRGAGASPAPSSSAESASLSNSASACSHAATAASASTAPGASK